MTDLEITRLCAEAMGVSVHEYQDGSLYHFGGLCEGGIEDYDPLHDDAQAMALVKRFNLAIEPGEYNIWRVQGREGMYLDKVIKDSHTSSKSLNRAICECVAADALDRYKLTKEIYSGSRFGENHNG